MHRLVTAPESDFRAVYEAARKRERYLAIAEYPARCLRRRGRVAFRTTERAVELVVDATPYLGAEATVRQLFETGRLEFSDLAEVVDFCRGPLAAAFAETDRPVEVPRIDPLALAERLCQIAPGQDDAVARLSAVVADGLARRRPGHPASVMMMGPRDVGMELLVRGLPSALEVLGAPPHQLYEVDCGGLVSERHAAALLGLWGGGTTSAPLVAALSQPRPIIAVRNPETAPQLFARVLQGLLGDGRLIAHDGYAVSRPDAVILLTSSAGSEELERSLAAIPAADVPATERACRAHLVHCGILEEIVDGISAMAVFEHLDVESCLRVAELAVRALAAERDIELKAVDAIVTATVADMASVRGATVQAFRHAARDLLAPVFAQTNVALPLVARLEAGPPPILVEATAGGGAR